MLGWRRSSARRRWTSAGLGLATVVAAAWWVAAAPTPATAVPVCPAAAPDADSAAQLAAACGQRVEVLSGRGESTQLFANPDGTSLFTSSAIPVRVHRADGSWVPVDTTLRVRADGRLAPVAALTDMAFSGGGAGPFATYRDAGSLVTLGLPVTLPAPRIEGSTAVYPNVWPDVDLRVTASATTFRHVFVVKSAAAAASSAMASIRLAVGGDVVAGPAGDGRVRFSTSARRTVAVTETATMWDSAVNPGATGEVTTTPAVLEAMKAQPPAELVSTERGPGATSRSAPVAVAASADGHGLELTPDASLLRGAATVLPLYIDPSVGPTRTNWAYSRSVNRAYAMDGNAWVGRNPPEYGGDGSLFRAFFDFPTTSNGQTYKGKHIVAASFAITLTHSYSCTNTVANAFRTAGITVANAGRMDWGVRPLGAGAVHLGTASGHANEAGGCGVIQPDVQMVFGANEAMLADVQTAANGGWNTYTIGLCACDADGANEATPNRWKRFRVDGNTTMSVTYNTVPDVPANLSPHQGQVACGGVVGTYSPVLQAQYVDADGADTLSATFNWQEVPSGMLISTPGPAKPANNNGSVTLNLGSGAEGRSYRFQVRTSDGIDTSPWSPWCAFTVDTTAPPAPVVTPIAAGSAPVYAACDPSDVDGCSATGGPGVAGAFRFSEPPGTAGQDVVSYVYGWDSPSVTVTAASPSMLLTPPRYGLNVLSVYSVDRAGRKSPTTNFHLLVDGPSAALAHWPLDSLNGHDLTDQVSGSALTAPGVTWTQDGRYVGARAAKFNGGLGGTQVVPALDTSGSFSVAAWVRLAPPSCAGNQTAVSVDADTTAANNHASAFYLGYDCGQQRWRMRVNDQNVAQPSTASAVSADNSAVAGRWTFLVGTYDENENKISLWVDGTLAQTATPPAGWISSRGAGWRATGPVVIGRDRWNDANGGGFYGEVADVRIWNRVVVGNDVAGTDANPATGVPAHAGLTAPMQVGWWTFPDGECFCAVAPDASPFGRPATLVPNWTLDPNWSGDPATTAAWLTADSHDGNGGLRLDGLSGYASTTDDRGTPETADNVTHPVLITNQSVTVAAWVKLDQITNVDQHVVHQGAMNLFYRGWEHKWGVTVRTPNGSGGYVNTEARSDVIAVTGSWVHLVGQFDAGTGQVRLYVNGVLQSVAPTGAAGSAGAESLTIGSYNGSTRFGGTIDDVRAWQGLLNAREIANLYASS